MRRLCNEQQRVACALGGIYTALSVDGVLPILHCGPGCIVSISSMLSVANGGQNAAKFMEPSLPCTNFCDSDVVFGGTDRLHTLIERSLEYYDAELFLVVGGCASGIIGDDIEEVTGRFADADKPVIHAELPGFKGDNLYGHGKVLNALIDRCAVSGPGNAYTDPLLVNVLGVVPHYDPMWAATLDKLGAMLTRIGLNPNILYGRSGGLDKFEAIPSAGFNLVVSPWADLDVAGKLKDRFGTPYLHYPNIPIGPTEEAAFIRALTEYAGLDTANAEAYIAELAGRYNYYIDRSLVWLFDMHNLRSLPREFFMNASAAQSLALSKFLVNDLGMSPRGVFIPEGVPEEYRPAIRNMFDEIESGNGAVSFGVEFTDDGGALEQRLKDVDQTVRKSVILGSVWDDLLAKRYSMPFVSVSAPYGDALIGDKTYFGSEGAIGLISDIYNDAAAKGLMSPVL
jgi:nitrogenase molybdenum-iron protein beta chain